MKVRDFCRIGAQRENTADVQIPPDERPLGRWGYIRSVDTLHLVRTITSPLSEGDLLDRGFTPKGNADFRRWVNNGTDDEGYKPRLTIYQTFEGRQRLRAEFSIPKLLFGNNVQLPSSNQIIDAMDAVAKGVSARLGQPFDSLSAEVHRIDYATNVYMHPNQVTPFIEYYSTFQVPRLVRTAIESETVYFRNKSRGFRIYNKEKELRDKRSTGTDVEKARGVVRVELFCNNRPAVRRIAERLNIEGATAGLLISEQSIQWASDHIAATLGLDKVDLAKGAGFLRILEHTGDVKKAIDLIGFREAHMSLGSDFYENPSYGYSRSSYDRHRKALLEYGITL
jgi:hypothetical protein